MLGAVLFMIYAVDKPDSGERRQHNREAHLAYLRAYHDHICQAGPVLDDDGHPCASLLLMDFPDRAAAERFAAGDPYAQAGLFQRVEIAPWKKVLP
jgi:hypothetical protein